MVKVGGEPDDHVIREPRPKMSASPPGTTNLCAVLYEKNDLRLEQRESTDLQPKKGEVLIAIRSVGICGSDVHFLKEGRIGSFGLPSPTVLGHEASGVVIAVGEDVTTLQLGDRVAIEPGITCRQCFYCKSGRYNLCPHVVFGSAPPFDGYLTNYKTHPADLCYKLPDHVSFDEGAFLEPLSVAVFACQRGQITLGDKVLVCGAGPIGLVSVLSAKNFGTSEIVVTDIDENRLKVAKECGATHIVKVNIDDTGEEVAQRVIDILGCRPDKTIECSGAPSAISAGIYATKSGGIVILVGLGSPEVKLPIVEASIREVDIRGVIRYVDNCFKFSLELIATGKADVKPLISHRYSLDKVLEAFDTAKTGKDGAIKVIVDCTATT